MSNSRIEELKQQAESGCREAYIPLIEELVESAAENSNNLKQAIFWLKKAKEEKIEDPMIEDFNTNLSVFIAMDTGLTDPHSEQFLEALQQEPNSPEQVSLLTAAMKGGNRGAGFMLSVNGSEADPSRWDPEKFFKLTKQLAESGLRSAYETLYPCYLDGTGTLRNLTAAIFWCTRAMYTGFGNLGVIYTEMTQTRSLEIIQGPQPPSQELLSAYEKGCRLLLTPRWEEGVTLLEDASTCGYTPAAVKLTEFYLQSRPCFSLADAEFFCYNLEARKINPGKLSLLQQKLEACRGIGKTYTTLYTDGCRALSERRYAAACNAFKKGFANGAPAIRCCCAHNLALLCSRGLGTPRNTQEACRWAKAAAENGYLEDYPLLAMLYAKNGKNYIDFLKAHRWLELYSPREREWRAGVTKSHVTHYIEEKEYAEIPSGNGIGRLELARAVYGSCLPSLSISCFEEAAERGSAAAMEDLSQLYEDGIAADPNPQKSFHWALKAAKAQPSGANCLRLSQKYLKGQGTEKDLNQAEVWAKKALELQNQSAQAILDIIGKEKSKAAATQGNEAFAQALALAKQGRHREALSLFDQAARSGNTMAMHNLGILYGKGLGVPQDPLRSFQWMKCAADRGCKLSYLPLAARYFNGTGTEKDLKAAGFWAKKSLDAGVEPEKAKQCLRAVQQSLSEI